jgi:hypothetical protein
VQEREEKQREELLMTNSNSVCGQEQAVPSYPAVVVTISSPIKGREGSGEKGEKGMRGVCRIGRWARMMVKREEDEEDATLQSNKTKQIKTLRNSDNEKNKTNKIRYINSFYFVSMLPTVSSRYGLGDHNRST